MPDLLYERQFDGPVIGIDEVGRGPWAGPVTATAIWLCPSCYDDLPADIDDSKKLTPARRSILASYLMELPHRYCTVSIDVKIIDKIGILQATFAGMVGAAKGLCDQLSKAQLPNPVHALIDGNLLPPNLPLQATAVVKGDSRSISIAAASIIAKTTRDQVMIDLDEIYPGYGWASNMGYGTKLHQSGLNRLGITPHHRKSFKPICRYLVSSK